MRIAVVVHRFSLEGIGGIETLALAAKCSVVCARVGQMERLKLGRNTELFERGGVRDVTAPRRRIVERSDVRRQLRRASDSANPFAGMARAL